VSKGHELFYDAFLCILSRISFNANGIVYKYGSNC
jgi:hypothetical protein